MSLLDHCVMLLAVAAILLVTYMADKLFVPLDSFGANNANNHCYVSTL